MPVFSYECRACKGIFEFDASSKNLPDKIPCPSCGSSRTVKALKPVKGATGTYKFVPALGTVVRVSSRVPGLRKDPSGMDSEAPSPSCPPGGCGGCNFG